MSLAADSLPLTSPRGVRLHDPAGPDRPMLPGSAADDGGADVRTLLDRLRYHWFLCLIGGSITGLAAAAAVWFLVPARYDSHSMLRVASTPINPVYADDTPMGRTEFETYLRTQAQIIKSQFVLAAALRDPKVLELPTIKRQADPIHWLEEELKVEFQSGSELMKLILEGDHPEDLPHIINAVQTAYLRDIVAEEQRRKQAKLVNLEDYRSKLESSLRVTAGELAKLRQPESEDGTNHPHDRLLLARLTRLQDDLTRNQNEQANLASKLEQARSLLTRVESMEVPPELLEDTLARSPKAQELLAKIERLTKQIDHHKHLLRDPGDTAGMEAKRKRLLAELNGLRQTARQSLLENRKKQRQAEITAGIESLIAEQTALTERERKLTTIIEEEKNRFVKTATTPPSFDASLLGQDVRHRSEVLERLATKIQALRFEVQAPPRVVAFQSATPPTRKDLKKHLMMMGMAGLAGFGLIGGLVSLGEARIGRVFGSRELRRLSGMPLLGTLPAVTLRQRADQLEQFGEAVDRIRAVAFASPHAPQMVLVSSADRREGRTTLASHLALSLVKSDRKTLLLDGDLRNPELHEALDLPTTPGLCEVLRGEVSLQEAIRRTPVNGLYFLAAGSFTADAREALAKDKLRKMLDRLRPEFAQIVIDSHPILAATDSLLLAQHVDAVLLATRKHAGRLPRLQQARQRLLGVGADRIGVVLLGE